MVSFHSAAQELASDDKSWRVGFRVGDPTGFQVQRILGKMCLELNAGRYFNFDRFDYSRWIYDEEPSLFNNNDRLQKYQINRSYMLQVNVTRRVQLDSVLGVNLYYGGGMEMRSMYLEYQFLTRSSGNVVTREIRRQDYGINGLLGMENEWEDQPLSVYADGGFFLALNQQFRPWLQFAVGIRYHFR